MDVGTLNSLNIFLIINYLQKLHLLAVGFKSSDHFKNKSNALFTKDFSSETFF